MSTPPAPITRRVIARAVAGCSVDARGAVSAALRTASADEVAAAIRAGLIRGTSSARRFLDNPRWVDEEDARHVDDMRQGITFVGPDDPGWPAGADDLARIGRRGEAPVGLWVKGELPDLTASVAIVGSRSASARTRERISKAVRHLPVPIVSGLAIGADTYAHLAALEHGRVTVAVLPSGVDEPYPARNGSLARAIVDAGGALISEYPSGTKAIRQTFLDRNRLIAAVTSGSLISEAGAISGTMGEARYASSLHRPIAAFRGSPGAESLIADGTAHAAQVLADIDVLYDQDYVR